MHAAGEAALCAELGGRGDEGRAHVGELVDEELVDRFALGQAEAPEIEGRHLALRVHRQVARLLEPAEGVRRRLDGDLVLQAFAVDHDAAPRPVVRHRHVVQRVGRPHGRRSISSWSSRSALNLATGVSPGFI